MDTTYAAVVTEPPIFTNLNADGTRKFPAAVDPWHYTPAVQREQAEWSEYGQVGA